MAKKKLEDKQMETVPLTNVLEQLEGGDENELGLDNKVLQDIQSEPPIPMKTAPEWSDWLMTQFHETELVTKKEDRGSKSYPRVHGLRRLSQIYVGEIVESVATPLQHSVLTTNEDGMTGFSPSTCLYTIKFRKADGQMVTYSDVGDCFWYSDSWSNQDRPFAVYPGPIAATRAEARCLRKALGLVTCSIEELGPQKNKQSRDTKETIVNPDEDVVMRIQDNQINFLDVQCKTERLNIHPLDFLKTISKNIKNVKEVSYVEAQNACKTVGELWRRKNNKEDSVTAYKNEKKTTIRPYSSSWAQE